MTPASLPGYTRSGWAEIDPVPSGMHACHFYSDRDQLVATLVPYFIAGLSANERCLWVTAPTLPAREAVRALRAAWGGVDDAILADALRILDFRQWYGSSARMTELGLLQLWLDEEERALASGCNGLRITSDMGFLKPGEWSTFMAYERAITTHFDGRRIVALCCYARAQCNDEQTSDVMQMHHCALERPDAGWQLCAPAEGPAYPENADSAGARS